MLLVGSTFLGYLGCSEKNDIQVESVSPMQPPVQRSQIDLNEVFEMRIEGKTEEAIALLRSLNDQYPSSVEILIQLARSLLDGQQFSLAAFRFEQALSLKPDNLLAKEAAEAHFLANDYDSAIQRYQQYLSTDPTDSQSQLRYARMLADKNRSTDALNAFSKASDEATADDCLIMGNLFFKKNLLAQAKHWFSESSTRSKNSPTLPLIGLLRVAKAEKNEENAETLILALEKTQSGILENTDLSEYSANLLRRRRLADFIARGVDTREKSVSYLASGLLAGRANFFKEQGVVTGTSKLPPPSPPASSKKENTLVNSPEPKDPQSDPTPVSNLSLADAFAVPIGKQIRDVSGASDSPLELGQEAYLDASYTSALLHARDALKEDSKNAQAWRLCSQAHFQLGEISQAEMTIIEAIRHQPFDLDMRMDYLRIARETLPSKRYLQELEKVRDLFPDSTEILWELARRYHMIENMPVTAAVLYRKIIQVAPANSALAGQAEVELLKLKNF